MTLLSQFNPKSLLTGTTIIWSLLLIDSILVFALMASTQFYHHIPVMQALVGWGVCTFLWALTANLLLAFNHQSPLLELLVNTVLFIWGGINLVLVQLGCEFQNRSWCAYFHKPIASIICTWIGILLLLGLTYMTYRKLKTKG